MVGFGKRTVDNHDIRTVAKTFLAMLYRLRVTVNADQDTGIIESIKDRRRMSSASHRSVAVCARGVGHQPLKHLAPKNRLVERGLHQPDQLISSMGKSGNRLIRLRYSGITSDTAKSDITS